MQSSSTGTPHFTPEEMAKTLLLVKGMGPAVASPASGWSEAKKLEFLQGAAELLETICDAPSADFRSIETNWSLFIEAIKNNRRLVVK